MVAPLPSSLAAGMTLVDEYAVLEDIAELEKIRKTAVENLVVKVGTARQQGWNWTVIAQALGLSRSSAMARYVKKIDYIDLRARDPWKPRETISE